MIPPDDGPRPDSDKPVERADTPGEVIEITDGLGNTLRTDASPSERESASPPPNCADAVPARCDVCDADFWQQNEHGQWRGFRIRTITGKDVCGLACEEYENSKLKGSTKHGVEEVKP